MKGIPQGRYTKEFREEAVKMVLEGYISLPEAACRGAWQDQRYRLSGRCATGLGGLKTASSHTLQKIYI
ncbi:MAG: hypothetical protein IBX72_15950 [Nitrospirae bacterium]|nr:hypothetical protein [Nitrospirota bacterium]